jgi:hypothetical protein
MPPKAFFSEVLRHGEQDAAVDDAVVVHVAPQVVGKDFDLGGVHAVQNGRGQGCDDYDHYANDPTGNTEKAKKYYLDSI